MVVWWVAANRRELLFGVWVALVVYALGMVLKVGL